MFYNQYRWLLPSLLFSCLLLVTRVAYTGSITFAFLLWNLFLAILPLYFSYRCGIAATKRSTIGFALLWLLFFPNAMYITTDLFHLHEHSDSPLWFDLLLLLSFALNGVVLGFISLTTIEKLMCGYVRQRYIGLLIFALLFLCGYGIYLGRYERWNSWDIITAPFALCADVVQHIIHPFRHIEVWLLSTLFGCWMFVLYRYVKRVA
jgi:uncharacterized membrane protein